MFGVIKPTFEPIAGSRDGSRQKKRDGGVLLEFAPAVGQRQYDWQNKQSILLSPLELVELTESLAVLGKGVNFFHDPGMGTARQGAMTKSLKAEPMPDAREVFLNLSTSSAPRTAPCRSPSFVCYNLAVPGAETHRLRRGVCLTTRDV